MPSTPSLLRAQPLAFALAVALALPFANEAMATPAVPLGSPAALPGTASSPRPDGSVLWSVENCNDAGAGSLRDAAMHANHGDGIDLGSLSCSTISVTSGAITLHDVELVGPGAAQLEIDGTGNQNRRIFNHAGGGGRLDISGVTINGGIYASNAGLGGGCDGHLVDPLRGQTWLSAEQFSDHLDDEVVGAGLGVLTLVAGLAERGAHPLDEDHVAQGPRRRCRPGGRGNGGRCGCR